MSSRAWQMVAAGVSVTVMVVVLFKYGLGDDPPPTGPAISEPHAGAQHHDEEQQHMGAQLAPLQVFANAKVGDWMAYRVLNQGTMLPSAIEAFVVARVTKVTDTTVTVAYKGNAPSLPERGEEWERERPRSGLTIDQLTGNDVSKWTLYSVAVTDETREVGGRTFKCKKLSWAATDPMFPTKRVRHELWISDEVPAGGLVDEHDAQDLDTTHTEQQKQLIGFGTADATTWGTRPADL